MNAAHRSPIHDSQVSLSGLAGAAPRAFTAIAATVILTVVVGNAWRLATKASEGQHFEAWATPQYWVDYRDGFVRRGLPGELLSSVSAGPPSLEVVLWSGYALTILATVALAIFSFDVAYGAKNPLHFGLTLAVLLISPLTLSLVLHDRGRYDAVGFIALVLMARLGGPKTAKHPWLTAIAMSSAISIAAASEEFLIAFLAPVAFSWVAWSIRPRLAEGWKRNTTSAALLLIALGPATTIAAASILRAPTNEFIERTLALATAAGVPADGPNAVTVLDDSIASEFAMVTGLQLTNLLLFTILFGGCYLATLLVVSYLVELPNRLALVVSLTVLYGILALALEFVGVDYRRWWSLSLVGVLACFQVLRPSFREQLSQSLNPIPLWVRALIGILLMASIPGGYLPVYPAWDPSYTQQQG